MRGIAFKGDVFEGGFVPAGARALGDGAFNGVLRHTFLSGFFQRGGQPGIGRGVGSAMPCGDGDFTDEFCGRLRFFQRGDLTFGQQPLSSHAGAG